MLANIIDYGMDGMGIAKIDGKTYFVSNALIGETVELEILSDKGRYAFARAVKVVEPSKDRVTPPCPYFSECGGCSIMHISYPHQLKYKRLLVEKTLKKILNIDLKVQDVVPSDQVQNYRNKISLSVRDGALGFFRSSSKDLIEIDACLLAKDRINDLINEIKNYYLDKDDLKKIKNIIIREIADQILIGVVAVCDIDLRELYACIHSKFDRLGVYLIINTRKDSVVISGKVKHVAGLKQISIENYDIKYKVDLVGFHQVNENVQNKIYDEILSYVDDQASVINAFSGAGLLSAIISKKAKRVYGIEIVPASHKSAQELKQINKIENMTNILGDFDTEFRRVADECSLLVLDPPKKGCGEHVMRQISHIKDIIYISCNPISLAKDLQFLKNDYIIEKIIPFDMFPNTTNVETLVKLKLKEEI